MGREGQTTFGYCLLLLSSSLSSSPSPSSISSPSSLSPPYCFYCPNCNHWSNLYSSSGKIYVGDYKYDKEDGIGVLRFFTKAADDQKMMITITRSGSETYEGEFVNGLRHGKVIDHFLSSTQTPHTFHIMENFFGKQLLRKPLRDGGF